MPLKRSEGMLAPNLVGYTFIFSVLILITVGGIVATKIAGILFRSSIERRRRRR